MFYFQDYRCFKIVKYFCDYFLKIRMTHHANCTIGTILLFGPIMKLAGGDIFSWLYRCTKARGVLHPWYNRGGPAKVGAGKFF